RISYSETESPCLALRSRSMTSVSRTLPSTYARQSRCWAASSQRGSLIPRSIEHRLNFQLLLAIFTVAAPRIPAAGIVEESTKLSRAVHRPVVDGHPTPRENPMPAVTADPLTLPRLPVLPQAETDWRRVARIVTAQRHLEGGGFEVRRPFPGVDLALADPFLLLDHMGAVEYAPGEAKGTPWHPHRGFETVTYIIDGAFQHQDTTGGGGLISDGATQWMTAASGIQHIEQPPPDLVRRGGRVPGARRWVTLPRAQKWVPPRYQDIEAGDVKLVAADDGSSLVRVIAGSPAGHDGPGVTYTPINYLHATVAPG